MLDSSCRICQIFTCHRKCVFDNLHYADIMMYGILC